ncbi:MAG TPA: hemerythrin domain-containing protein [Burkholderiales bacterium]|nr:hemerythrin domain-containing protein [Burkholderiales bacterium]
MAQARKKRPSAIDLLKQDHREVEMLFKEFEQLHEQGEDAATEPVIQTACIELKIHDKLETEIFYPAIRAEAGEEETDLLDEAEVEHDTVRELIQKLEGMDPSDEKKHAHFTVLMEYVKHHVKEEEKEMFPKVKQMDIDFRALGEQMTERKAELMSEMGVEAEETEDEETT